MYGLVSDMVGDTYKETAGPTTTKAVYSGGRRRTKEIEQLQGGNRFRDAGGLRPTCQYDLPPWMGIAAAGAQLGGKDADDAVAN